MADPTYLEVLRGRLQSILMDTNAKSWTTDALDEAIRLALMDVGFAAGSELTIAGLDSLSGTTLATQDEGTLLTGATAYATAARVIDLAEKNSAGKNPVADLRDYSKDKMTLFNQQLERIRRRGLNNATTAPHTPMAWNEEPPNFEGYGDGPQSGSTDGSGTLVL